MAATNPERKLEGPFHDERQRRIETLRLAVARSKEARHAGALVPVRILESALGYLVGERAGFTEADVDALEGLGMVERV